MVRREGDDLVVEGDSGSIRLRYVELRRDDESEEDEDEDPTLDRVEAELYVKLSEERRGVPAAQWVKLAYVYCHDSYDGNHTVVLESEHLWAEPFAAACEAIGVAPSQFFDLVAEHTGCPEGIACLSENSPAKTGVEIQKGLRG